LRVDAHLHVHPPAYVEALRALPGGLPPMPIPTLAGAREHMARFGIDAAVVSAGPPGVFFGDRAQARELARVVNEFEAELVRAEPERFAALASLPLPDVDAALAELAHALDVLGLDGVWLPTNVGGTYLGEPALEPLFDELERRGAYVLVHPSFPPYRPPLEWPVWLVELPFETTRALVQLLYSGTLDRCPSVRLQLAHLGGTVPFLAERIASLVEREPRFRAAIGGEPASYLARLWYDTGLANARPGLAATEAVAPLERIVFGTDWPYAALPAEGADPAPELASLGERRRLVDAANVAALVPRFGEERQWSTR
jgi:predicted TIM-barrel fold metal-dependent hydrolase